MAEKAAQPLQELVRRARASDREAFDRLALSFRERLLALIAARLGRSLRASLDVEDIFQETLLRAFGSIARFEWRDEESLFRWLASIATHRILELASRAAVRREERLGDREPEIEGRAPTSSRVLRRQERFERLEAALAALPAKYREVLLMARVEGLPIREIARRLGRSPNSISQMVLRGLRRLRQIFGDTESLSLPARILRRDGDSDGA